jgi:TniQ
MSSYIYQSSELWDIGKPLIPERSFLNHLEPIGISTPFMESLTSYIARLALSHSVVTGILISRVITSLLEQVFVKNTTSRALGALFNRSTALNGTGIIAMDFVQALEKLTLQRNLHFLTLLFWNKIISPRGLFRSHKAWCPACYQQWRLLGKEIYEPLAWTINAVKICPQHCQLLKDRCPYCQATLPLLTWRTLLGYCSNCGQWLGITEDMASSYHSEAFSTEEVHLLTWIAETVGELITVTPDLPSPPPKENIAKSLGIAIDIV